MRSVAGPFSAASSWALQAATALASPACNNFVQVWTPILSLRSKEATQKSSQAEDDSTSGKWQPQSPRIE
jgi:hypothetical protein